MALSVTRQYSCKLGTNAQPVPEFRPPFNNNNNNNVTLRLNAGIMERVEAVIARQLQGKHLSRDTIGQQTFPW
jgi:hypothetical protein